ncbi:hypothetical protein OKW98_18320 [Pseudomonas sp. KU26590]|uniref:hypothetical protein n=1 Tax=Pseudomonas sp. KU26590 TaxID=2991051 RepID=UPI00223E1021|nr:hypothetical protein [Pseudomonas sp. KU26590]UZJ58536.1 hypothetical protein OKW98_18320 [Pseudomonas sp. KU26590]
MAVNDAKERELKIWNDYLDHEARRESAADRWHGELLGHANALARLGVIDEEELREMLELADSALEHVKAQLETREWLEEKG